MWGFLNNIWNVSKVTDSIYFYSFTFMNFFTGDPVFMTKLFTWTTWQECVQGIHNANFECVVWLSNYSFHIHPVIFACSSWSCSMCLARGWIAGKLLFSFYLFVGDWEFQSSLKWKDGHELTMVNSLLQARWRGKIEVENDDGMMQWLEWIWFLGLWKLSNWAGLNQAVKDNWSLV